MQNKEQNLSIDDLRKIIHSLKMSNFSFLETSVLSIVDEQIKALPSSEALGKLLSTPLELKRVREQIGNVMQIIDYYGTKNKEYKTRYKALTKLPPRYQVLDYKKASKELLNLSVSAENKGNNILADYLINKAESALEDKIDIDEVIDRVSTAGMPINNLIKIAQNAPTVTEQGDLMIGNKSLFEDPTQVSNIQQAIKAESWTVDNGVQLMALVQAITKQMQALKDNMSTSSNADNSDAMKNILSNMQSSMESAINGWNDFSQVITDSIEKADKIITQKELTTNYMRNNGINITQNR